MTGLAVDATAGTLFLSPRSYDAIQEADLDGGNLHALANVGGFAATLSIGPAISPVPEPASIALLALGFCTLLYRRKSRS